MSIINKRNASQLIVDYILDQIQSGVLKKGDKLMTEHEFSELLGVSRIPLREALCALSTVGILESRQGGGTFVTTKCDPSVLGRMLYAYALLGNVDFRQVLSVRVLLEPEAARQAALQASQRQKEEIWELAETYRHIAENYAVAEQDNPKIAQLDHALHFQIVRASHNDFLWMVFTITTPSFEPMNTYNYFGTNDHGEKNRKLFSQQHTDIAQAILDGDGAKAYKAMDKHLQSIWSASQHSAVSLKEAP